MDSDPLPESLEGFKNSFSYGSRTDMNFKFLKNLSEKDAAQFFQDLLWKLGDASNDGMLNPIIEHIYQWQVNAYRGKLHWEYEDAPITRMSKPLSPARLGLLTISGHFVEGDDPQPFGVTDMSQKEALMRISEFLKEEPPLSRIPIDTPREKLRVRHGGYDIRAAQLDLNTVFPLDRILELEKEGKIGEVMKIAYSFVGASSQYLLMNKAIPKWIDLLKDHGVDGMILVPV
jgi:hypothetical protein